MADSLKIPRVEGGRLQSASPRPNLQVPIRLSLSTTTALAPHPCPPPVCLSPSYAVGGPRPIWPSGGGRPPRRHTRPSAPRASATTPSRSSRYAHVSTIDPHTPGDQLRPTPFNQTRPHLREPPRRPPLSFFLSWSSTRALIYLWSGVHRRPSASRSWGTWTRC